MERGVVHSSQDGRAESFRKVHWEQDHCEVGAAKEAAAAEEATTVPLLSSLPVFCSSCIPMRMTLLLACAETSTAESSSLGSGDTRTGAIRLVAHISQRSVAATLLSKERERY